VWRLGKLIEVRRLIVNADDFGLTSGINRAVSELHAAAALSSATLMASAPRFAEAVAMAAQQRSLGVGCHVVLVDGTPAADRDSIPTLLVETPQGKIFRPTLAAFVRDVMLGRIARTDIEREATAQIRRLQQAGVHVTHVDTHKHTHMFPAVLDALTRAASACGVHAIRNPFEPAWSVAATPNPAPMRRLQIGLLGGFRGHFSRMVREREFSTTDGCIGVLATGSLDESTLAAIVSRIPEGTWELVCHPAVMDEELRATRTRLLESRVVELVALHSLPKVLSGDIRRIHFGQV
jgi:predicted glycoside hydrolase/deacetylase ChbG (UPF0249 family)